MTLLDSGQVVHGNGTLGLSGAPPLGITITGTHVDSAVNLDFANPSFSSAFYSGKLTTPTTIRGLVNGSGFVDDTLILTKS